jgi:hypothetical protein
MRENVFSEGLFVRYRNCVGHIKFMCEEYITVCIHTNSNPLKDVCILVYSDSWEDVELLDGNRGRDK